MPTNSKILYQVWHFHCRPISSIIFRSRNYFIRIILRMINNIPDAYPVQAVLNKIFTIQTKRIIAERFCSAYGWGKQHFPACPGFYRRSTPGALNNSNRNILIAVNFTGKIIGNRRKLFHICRITNFPFTR